jgi:hypothetical protein
MNKTVNIILVVIIVIAIALSACFVFGIFSSESKLNDSQISVVTQPQQKTAETPPDFTEDPNATVPEAPEGDNLALGASAKANGFTDVYQPSYAIDGDRAGGSYWEGKAFELAGGSDTFQVTMDKAVEFNTICIKLNENKVWAKRTQTFSIEGSDDGKNWKEILPSTEYKFDPKTGNFVVASFDKVKYKCVQITFTANSGAVGGQMAELEIFNLK